MNTSEVIQHGRFYLLRVPGMEQAYLSVIGPEVEAWYREEQTRLAEDNTIREKNWFLTSSKIVSSISTAKGISFTVYERSRIAEVRQNYALKSAGGQYLELAQVTLTFENGKTFDLPMPHQSVG